MTPIRTHRIPHPRVISSQRMKSPYNIKLCASLLGGVIGKGLYVCSIHSNSVHDHLSPEIKGIAFGLIGASVGYGISLMSEILYLSFYNASQTETARPAREYHEWQNDTPLMG
jgi:hypothetical protein